MPFGAFVNILPGKDGMVHVSDMSEGYVADANDVVTIGQKVQVRVKEVDEMGRINLSMRMDPSTDKPKEDRRPSGGDRGHDRGGRPSFNRGGGDRGSRNNFGRDNRPPARRAYGSERGNADRPASEGRSSGPHFPTSRYFQTGTNVDR